MFFGAVLSAVMSCSSATLFAPSVILSENVIQRRDAADGRKGALTTMRIVLVVLCRRRIDHCAGFRCPASTRLVVNTYKVTLWRPLFHSCAGLFWKRATTQGALCAIAAGLAAWLGLEFLRTEQRPSGPHNSPAADGRTRDDRRFSTSLDVLAHTPAESVRSSAMIAFSRALDVC